MPSYTPESILKRVRSKPDIHSRAIQMLCEVGMGSTGPHLAVSSRRNRDILRALMMTTGWNMVLVGMVPLNPLCSAEVDANAWAMMIDVAAEAEFNERAPKVDRVVVCSEGILVRFCPSSLWGGSMTSRSTQRRLQRIITETARRFMEYDSWGETLLRPVVAEENS